MPDDILFVPYIPRGAQQGQWIDIYTRLNQERILFLNQAVTDGIANSVISALLYLDSEDQTKPIYLYINSLGDPVAAGMASVTAGMVSINAGLAIYDTMQHVKSEIVTICLGQAVGMAAVLLSAGAKAIAQDMQRTFYLNPQQAQEYGLIDRVLQSPKLASLENLPVLT